MKKYIFVICMIGLSGCLPKTVYKAPIAKGIVVDAISKQPIAGAAVVYNRYITEPYITKEDGSFVLGSKKIEWLPPLPDAGMPLGTVTMCISKIGYRKRCFDVTDERIFTEYIELWPTQ